MKFKPLFIFASIIAFSLPGCSDDSNNVSKRIEKPQNPQASTSDNDASQKDASSPSENPTSQSDETGKNDGGNKQDGSDSSTNPPDDSSGHSDPANPSGDVTNEDTDPALDPSIPRDVIGGLDSRLEEFVCEADEPIDCDGSFVIECKNDHYYIREDCSANADLNRCTPEVGCTACIPGALSCQDNDVYVCNDDGKSYSKVKSCGFNKCEFGACMNDNCPEYSQFIYLVDADYNLIKFNPGSSDGNYLHKLFSLTNCGYSYSTPFSMAVDREANAWVLYSDSSLYKISIENQTCKHVTNFRANGSGLSTFGMAFSLDAVGGDTDTLYIADIDFGGSFGRLQTENMSYTQLASFPDYYDQTPELTGTGLAKLYAFSPGNHEQHISEIDKSTGNVIHDYLIPGAGGSINAWAFAHWGGKFFMFETVSRGFSSDNKILRFDPETGETDVFMKDTPYRVVGAGVSTCAPVEVIN